MRIVTFKNKYFRKIVLHKFNEGIIIWELYLEVTKIGIFTEYFTAQKIPSSGTSPFINKSPIVANHRKGKNGNSAEQTRKQ